MALLATAAVMPLTTNANEHNDTDIALADDKGGIEPTLEADIVSRFIWRGQNYGSVSLQPTVGLTWRGLSLTAWGNVGLTQSDYNEVDLTIGYEHPCGLRLSLTDYWAAEGRLADNHVVEGNIGFDFGPLSLDWYTNFAGDYDRTDTGRQAYSSYVEANVPFRLLTCDWTATIGAVPFRTDFYDSASGFAVVNIGLLVEKEIAVTPRFGIPLFAGAATNPSNKGLYLWCGLTVGI